MVDSLYVIRATSMSLDHPSGGTIVAKQTVPKNVPNETNSIEAYAGPAARPPQKVVLDPRGDGRHSAVATSIGVLQDNVEQRSPPEISRCAVTFGGDWEADRMFLLAGFAGIGTIEIAARMAARTHCQVMVEKGRPTETYSA
jgi:hypothetical protein